MRADARRRYRKAVEITYALLQAAPTRRRQCYFCHKDLIPHLQSRGTQRWDITLHHKNEDRTKACRKVWPLCPHVKRLAHDLCHRRHHIGDQHKNGSFTRPRRRRRSG